MFKLGISPPKKVSSSEKDDMNFDLPALVLRDFLCLKQHILQHMERSQCFERIRYKIGKPVILELLVFEMLLF